MKTPSSWIDSLGSLGALVCAIHCAALPLLFAMLPAIGLGFLASAGFERGFLLFATVLGLGSLWRGYRQHGALRALALLVPGLCFIGVAIWVPVVHGSAPLHAILMTCGGTLIAVAHWTNLSLSRQP